MSSVTVLFDVCLVIFMSLIEYLTRGTVTLQNEILTVLRFHHCLYNFMRLIW